MPALLQILEERKVSEYCVPSPAAPLALAFPLGGPQLGVFCALTCFLVSDNNQFPGPWQIKLNSDSSTPFCLYRNCIRFSVPRLGSVTLVDTFSHFQVHVQTGKEERYSKLCSVARQAIMFGVRSVSVTLGYANCTPSLAFVCPCKKGVPHAATMEDGDWVCEKDSEMCGTADARYLVWGEEACKQKGE